MPDCGTLGLRNTGNLGASDDQIATVLEAFGSMHKGLSETMVRHCLLAGQRDDWVEACRVPRRHEAEHDAKRECQQEC